MYRHVDSFDGEDLRVMVKQLSELAILEPVLPSKMWQSQEAGPQYATHELTDITLEFELSEGYMEADGFCQPSQPWAEDHFLERVSGEPLNPPPSAEYWPHAQKDNEDHKELGVFSHTYPERFWPKYAQAWAYDAGCFGRAKVNEGIRYEYGDLDDLIDLMAWDPYTRQAYLPIFFPEDTGAVEGQRIPCTLGYHFTLRPVVGQEGVLRLDMRYYMRSCDLLRHFQDDVYMAMRLAQVLVNRVILMMEHESIHEGDPDRAIPTIKMGRLLMYVASLHVFAGDVPAIKYKQRLGLDPRSRSSK